MTKNVCNTCPYRRVFLWMNFCRLAKKKYAMYRRWIYEEVSV